MSEVHPAVPDTESANLLAADVTFIRFPPFPTPPEGAEIIPFEAFKECGIRLMNDDEQVELDGRGIPTVELRSSHEMDMCKTNAKRKRKEVPKAAASTSAGRNVRKEWWQSWEEREESRMYSYDPHLSPIDRFHSAASDFKNRPWTSDIQNLWDQFRLFVGLLSPTPKLAKKKGFNQQPEIEGDFSDDDSVSSKMDVVILGDSDQSNSAQQTCPDQPPETNGENDEGPDPEEDVFDENKDDKLNAFLNDPEASIKIFLSSFMAKQGLIWSDRNLNSVPRLISIFFKFLIRNRALPDSTHERALRRALAVAELAMKELPLTSKIAKTMPDNFHLACRACWDRKSEGYHPLPPVEDGEDQHTEEPDAKRQKLDAGDSAPDLSTVADDTNPPAVAIEEEFKFVEPDLTKEIIEDNVDGGGWGAEESGGGGGWGGGAWGDSGDYWDTERSAFGPVDFSSWDPPVHSLMALLGPTSLPITHTTGIVESSVRRIKSVTLPPQTVPRKGSGGAESWALDPEAVEMALEGRFAKVVFEPWLGWDLTEDANLSNPRILETSRGAVAPVEGESANEDAKKNGKPHDPFKNDITVLVEPSTIASLGVGIGVGAIWVQLAHAPVEDGGEENVAVGSGKSTGKKKKGKGKENRERYWYIDELTMTLPSYHISLADTD